MRLFFAVAIPDDLIKRVEELQDELRERAGDEGIHWTRPDQYHYTLKFLGEHNFSRAESAATVADGIATEVPAFDLTLSGIGAFPNSQRPSTLWLGASQGAPELTGLAARLDEVLYRRGFQKERKPVKAHLTLARIKTYGGEVAIARLLRQSPPSDCGTFTIDRFVLMRSVLKPEGSDYSVLKEFELVKHET